MQGETSRPSYVQGSWIGVKREASGDPVTKATGSGGDSHAQPSWLSSDLVFAVHVGIALLAAGTAFLLVAIAVPCFRRIQGKTAVKGPATDIEKQSPPAETEAACFTRQSTQAETQLTVPTLLETVGAISESCLDPTSKNDVLEILRGKNLCLRQDIVDGNRPLRIMYPLQKELGPSVIRVTDLPPYFDD